MQSGAIIVLGFVVLVIAVVLIRMIRTRKRRRFQHNLRKGLLLTHDRTFSLTNAIEAPAGTPYRVIAKQGGAVKIEILLEDGKTIQGYTSTAHVRTRRSLL